MSDLVVAGLQLPLRSPGDDPPQPLAVGLGALGGGVLSQALPSQLPHTNQVAISDLQEESPSKHVLHRGGSHRVGMRDINWPTIEILVILLHRDNVCLTRSIHDSRNIKSHELQPSATHRPRPANFKKSHELQPAASHHPRHAKFKEPRAATGCNASSATRGI